MGFVEGEQAHPRGITPLVGVKTLDEGPALIRDVSLYKPLFVGAAVFVVVPVVLTVLAWDELLPHVVERWSGSSALARVWVSAGGGGAASALRLLGWREDS